MSVDLRDQFAMAAIQGLLSSDVIAFGDWRKGETLVEDIAKDAYKLADAMLKVKAAQKKQIPVHRIT